MHLRNDQYLIFSGQLLTGMFYKLSKHNRNKKCLINSEKFWNFTPA